MPKRLAPTIKTLRTLFARSGNQCAFPGCYHPLIDEDENFIGQICHIEDALPGGRFNENMTEEQRRSPDNLILFCYPHHIKTNNIQKYTVSWLRKIKEEHEAKFTESFFPNESTLIKIFDDLKSIKEDTTKISNDTNEIRNSVKETNEQVQELKKLINHNKQDKEETKTAYLKEIERIITLRDRNKQTAALDLLEDYKLEKWEKLDGYERYKLTANIGICKLELDKDEEAADYFIESLMHDPKNEKALGFAALGYIIKGENESARTIINEALEKNPHNINANVAMIKLQANDIETTELLNRITPELHDSQEICYALGEFARRNNDFEIAIRLFQNAVDNSGKNKGELKATLATAILESITNPIQIITGQIDFETHNKINYCIQLFTEAWNEFKYSDLIKSRAWILINRGIAKKFINQLESAYEDIKQATEITEYSYFHLRHLAIVAIELNKLDYSLELLDQLENTEPKYNEDAVDVNLFKAEVHYKKREYAKAISYFKKVIRNNISLIFKKEAQSNLIITYLANENYDAAIELCESIIKGQPDYIRGYINASMVYSHLNNNEKSIDLLNKAYEHITDETSHLEIKDLALQFIKNKAYLKAIEILEKVTNKNIYSELSKALLEAYYYAGEYGKSLKLCNTIREYNGPVDIIAEIQSTIYESIGDLPKAMEVCEEYLSVYPEDQLILVRLAIINSRLNKKDKVKSILKNLDVIGNLPIDIIYQLAYLNITVGEVQRGLDIAFETRRKHNTNKNAHIRYIILLSEYSSLINQDFGKYEKVQVNTVVRIKDESEKFYTYYILDAKERMTKEEILVNDKLATKLIGAKVGDVIKIEQKIGSPKTIEVVDILNKYAFAYQESIYLLQNKFIETDDIKFFKTGGTGDFRKDLKPILDSLDENEKITKQIYDYYNKQILTIGACAKLKNLNPINFWSLVTGNHELGVYSISSHTDFQESQSLLYQESGVVIDLISLLTFASIKELGLIEEIKNKKVIARSTVDNIDKILKEFEGINSEGYITIGKMHGEYVKEHFTKERIDEIRTHYEYLINWIDKHCEILPCNEALTINAFEKEHYDKTLGTCFIDSILIAKEHNYLLLAEEESLRAIAFNDFQVVGFPSYVLFHFSFNQKLIDQNQFDDEITKLIQLGYKYLPVSADILMKCLDKSGYKPVFPFDLAIKTFNYSISSEDSSIHVAVDFMYKLYSSVAFYQVPLNIIPSLLSILVKGRNHRIVFNKLIALIEVKFKLLQKQKDELFSILNNFFKHY